MSACALYTRVSTEQQVKGESLADQEQDGRAWAEAHGHQVVAVYSDPGLSGKLPADERPGLAAALEALEVGTIDVLVIRDLDRLARELTVQEAVLAQVWQRPDTVVVEYGRAAVVLGEPPAAPRPPPTRLGWGGFPALARTRGPTRLRDGRRSKARRGQHANGPAPYGWRTEGGELLPVADELHVLALIRDLASDRLRQADIAAALNAEGHRTREGAPWSQPVVSRVLRRDAERTPERIAYEAEQLAKHAALL